MFRIVFVTLVAFYFADAVDYHATQSDVTLKALTDNPYFKLKTTGSEYPSGIEYLQDIDSGTNLTIRVIFGNKDGPLDPANAENTALNICKILDNELDNLKSAQKRYKMASSLGLEGKRCPIQKGVKSIVPYSFPTEFTTKDLGCGDRYYEMRVGTADQNLESVPLLELHVNIKLTKDNEPCTESSSSVMSLPSITACFVVALYFSRFIN